jgi:hypothetical protein
MSSDVNELSADEYYGEIIEHACDLDREYFLQHPDEDSYVRPIVKGEFWPITPDADMVEVIQIVPGVRTRTPFCKVSMVSDP